MGNLGYLSLKMTQSLKCLSLPFKNKDPCMFYGISYMLHGICWLRCISFFFFYIYIPQTQWFLFFVNLFIYFIIYFWLCWVFVSVRGLSLVVASGGHSSSRYVGLLLSRPLLLRSTGSRRAGSVVVAHGPSCSTACGIFPDQGSNPCPLH